MHTKSELSTGLLLSAVLMWTERSYGSTGSWKSKQVHRVLNEGKTHLNSLGVMEHSPNEDYLVESSAGESTFSKTITLPCTS